MLELIGKTITGKQFNQIFKGTKFVKLTNKKQIHNNFKFKNGLNVDINAFNPHNECTAGGIYFTDINKMKSWIYYRNDIMRHIRDVTLPDDAQIYVENDKFKADKMILGSKKEIRENVYIEAIKAQCISLHHIPECLRSKNICIASVETYGSSLRYVPESMKDMDMCMKAVESNGYALKFVSTSLKNKTMCEMAIFGPNGNALALEYVPHMLKDKELCMFAIKQNCCALIYVPDHLIDENMCIEVIKQNNYMTLWIPDHIRKSDKIINMLHEIKN